MDTSDMRKMLFYIAFAVMTALVLLFISGYTIGYNPLNYYFPLSSIELSAIIFILAIWLALVLLGKKGLGGENKNETSMTSTFTLLFFVYLSTFISILYLQNTVNKYYLLMFLFALIPLYTIQDFRRDKRSEVRKRKTALKKSIPQDAAVVATILLTGYMILSGNFTIVYAALSVLVLTLLSMAGGNKQYSRQSYVSVRVVLPYAGAYLIYEYYALYDVIDSSGILLLAIVTLGVLFITGFLVVFRKRKGVYTAGMLLLFIISALGILNEIAFYSLYPVTLLILVTVVAWLVSLSGDGTLEDMRNIGNSFKLFKYSGIYFGPVFLIALYGFLRLFQYPFLANYPDLSSPAWFNTAAVSTINFAIYHTRGVTAVLVLSLSAVAVVVGSKRMNAILFPFLLFLFVFGLYNLVSVKVPGIWEIPSLYTNLVVTIVTIALFYEPTFRFARSYSSRISKRFSLSYQVGTAKYLRGRFDVDTTVDKKKNKDYLGAGGFAYVFKARDILTNSDVVIKLPRVFDEESKTDREKKQMLQESIRQLYAESKILNQIDYPGIVRLVDYIKEGDQHFLVEEYADGKNMSNILGDNVRNGTPLDEPTTIRVALSLLFSINYLHLHEIYHRDLNPGNIVLSKTGPKIIDFGTSKSLSMRVSTAFFAHSQRIGVPCYHPPELDLEDRIIISPSYDTYSVGALICSMLTGQFLDSTEMKKNYGFEFITEDYLQREIRPRSSDWFYRIITKTLSYKTEDRYQSAFEMIADIMGISGNFIVTDLGFVHPLERESYYDFAFSSTNRVPELGSNLIRSRRIELYDEGRNSNSVLGRLSFVSSNNTFRLQASGRRSFYIKSLGAYPEKENDRALAPRQIYSFRQDMKDGTFSFYTVR